MRDVDTPALQQQDANLKRLIFDAGAGIMGKTELSFYPVDLHEKLSLMLFVLQGKQAISLLLVVMERSMISSTNEQQPARLKFYKSVSQFILYI